MGICKRNFMKSELKQNKQQSYYFIFVLFAFALLYCVYHWMNIWTPPTHTIIFSETEVETEHEIWKTGCPNIGGGPQGVVVTVVPGGRLGNQVWEYLSVFAVAKRYSVWPAVPSSMLDVLEKSAFTSLRIPSVTDIIKRCNLTGLEKKIKSKKSTGNQGELIKAMEYKENKAVSVIVLRQYIIDKDNLFPYWQELSSEIKLKEEFVISSQKELQSLKATFFEREVTKTTSSFLCDINVEYVGVHVRRTDYTAFVKKHGIKPANENFFLRAMEEMRQYLQPKNVMFVVVSDDLDWCHKYFQAPDIIIAGDGNLNSPGHDLALLAACNHTIFAYGTFGLTAVLYNTDGITIVHDGTTKKGVSSATYFAKHLPNWKIL